MKASWHYRPRRRTDDCCCHGGLGVVAIGRGHRPRPCAGARARRPGYGPVWCAREQLSRGNGATDCSLGSVETSVTTCPGGAFDFDVILDDLPLDIAQEGLGAVDFQLRWGGAVAPPEADVIDITARAPINQQIHLLAQAAGSWVTLGDPQALPVVTPPYEGSSYDIGTDETNPPFTDGPAGATQRRSLPPRRLGSTSSSLCRLR